MPFTYLWPNGEKRVLAGATVQRHTLGPINPDYPNILGEITRVSFPNGAAVYQSTQEEDCSAWYIEGATSPLALSHNSGLDGQHRRFVSIRALLHDGGGEETIRTVDEWLVLGRIAALQLGVQVMSA